MAQDAVLTQASALLGRELTDAQTATLSALCAAALAQCLRRVDESDADALTAAEQAAALLAGSWYLDAAEEDVTAFTAGKLSVRCDGPSPARRWRQAAEELLSPWSGGFAFLGVET